MKRDLVEMISIHCEEDGSECVVSIGEGLSDEDAIEMLLEAVDHIRKTRDDSLLS